MKCEEASTSEVRFHLNRVKAFSKKLNDDAHANGQHLNTSGRIMKFILWLKTARKVHPAPQPKRHDARWKRMNFFHLFFASLK